MQTQQQFRDVLGDHDLVLTDDERYELARAGAIYFATEYRGAANQRGEIEPLHESRGRTMTVTAERLEFVSRIERDGSKLTPYDASLPGHGVDPGETFRCYVLSLTAGTWVAHGFNSFVVRLKL